MAKRLRILAGPNGSGKSSVYYYLRNEKTFHWGAFVNADEIEQHLRQNQFLDIATYGIEEIDWDAFKREYEPFAAEKNGLCQLGNLLYIGKRIIVIDAQQVDSYLACFVADYIRRALLEVSKDITFTVETVMSHPGKLDFIRAAKSKGFRVYLYYVSTSSPDINVGRVATRVQRGGHDVPEDKIRSRYVRSLKNLRQAVLLSDRAYIFDNSSSAFKWVAEYDGKTGELFYKAADVPQWVECYLTKK